MRIRNTNSPLRANTLAKALVPLLLLVSCAMVSANEIQRLSRELHMALLLHENQPPPERDAEGAFHLQGDIGLVQDEARIAVAYGQDIEPADEIAAVFAVSPPNEQPAELLTVAMAHIGDGLYRAADESRSRMKTWFVDRSDRFRMGELVLLRIDGLPEGLANNAIRFEIAGECPMCEHVSF